MSPRSACALATAGILDGFRGFFLLFRAIAFCPAAQWQGVWSCENVPKRLGSSAARKSVRYRQVPADTSQTNFLNKEAPS